MTRITWDKPEQRNFETGVDHGVLFPVQDNGSYGDGVPWNGLTAVTESPSGGEAQPFYADNIKYLNLVSNEDFAATIEAVTYPDEFEECDGSAEISPGVTIGQQNRRNFGFSYRTLKGNAVRGIDFGYKIHLVYGGLAAPSEKARNTVNENVEPGTFSWEVSTTPVPVGTLGGKYFKPTAHLTIDSTTVTAAQLTALENIIYGTSGAEPRMPTPTEVYNLTSGSVTTVSTQAPSYNSSTKTITFPSITGVVYKIDGEPQSAPKVITKTTVVTADPAPGYAFSDTSDTDWTVNFT